MGTLFNLMDISGMPFIYTRDISIIVFVMVQGQYFANKWLPMWISFLWIHNYAFILLKKKPNKKAFYVKVETASTHKLCNTIK